MAGTGYYANILSKAPASDDFAQKGKSNQQNMKSIFSASPIIGEPADGEFLTPEERLEVYQDLALDGEVLNGNGFNQFNRDYQAPNIDDVDLETNNLPSPYVPNPTSPGPGSLDAADKPAFEGKVRDPATINQFGSGNTSTYNPAVSAKKLSDLKIGGYIPGDSGGN